MNQQQKQFLLLIKSAVTDAPIKLAEDFSLEELEPLARKQALSCLIFQGACNCGIDPAGAVMQRLQTEYLRFLLHSERQLLALERLLSALETAGVKHLMVKGAELKCLYPRPELRPMGDADILISTEQYPSVRNVMGNLGYTFTQETDHVYHWKSPSLSVELHKSLVPPSDDEFYRTYGTGWEYACSTGTCRYTLSSEDSFVFLMVHFARHYLRSGIGCRHMVDLYVFRRGYPDLDWEKVNRELQRLGLEKFSANVLRTLDVWFEGAQPDPVTERITEYVFSGGTWGQLENVFWSNSARNAARGEGKHSRLKAALRMIFPSAAYMGNHYSILQRRSWLAPVFWVIRWVDILLLRPQKIRRKLRALGKINDRGAEQRLRAFQAVGLDFFGENNP